MIGTIAFPREQEIGYKLHPDYWGKGYMSEALKMFLEMFWNAEGKCLKLIFENMFDLRWGWLFGAENKKYNEICAFADPDNKGSTRVLEKAGFQKGVLLKDRYSRAYLDKKVKSDLQGFSLTRPGTEEKR